jgi:hypothetical protein
MTRGVCGTRYCFDEAIACCQQCAKDGSGDERIKPVSDRPALVQRYATFSRNEWRSRRCGRSREAVDGASRLTAVIEDDAWASASDVERATAIGGARVDADSSGLAASSEGRGDATVMNR